MSARVLFIQLKKVESVFCSGVYVAKNTLRKARSGSETPLLKKGYALFE